MAALLALSWFGSIREGIAQQGIAGLFPFIARNGEEAKTQCGTLLVPDNVPRAARGALVTVSAGSGSAVQSLVVAARDVPEFVAQLAQPPAGGRIAVTIGSSAVAEVLIIAHYLDAPEFSVACRYQRMAGAMRLVGIDFPLIQRTR